MKNNNIVENIKLYKRKILALIIIIVLVIMNNIYILNSIAKETLSEGVKVSTIKELKEELNKKKMKQSLLKIIYT